MGSMRDKMHTGELYLPDDPEIMRAQTQCLERLYDYNATRPSEGTRQRGHKGPALQRRRPRHTLPGGTGRQRTRPGILLEK